MDWDSKNYHAWSHRQWALKHFKLFDGEIAFIEQMISKDVRNNSAWNQRYFVISETVGNPNGKDFPFEIRKREIMYALTKCELAPNNECPWVYMEPFLKGYRTKFEEVRDTFYKRWKEGKQQSIPMLAFLVNWYAADKQTDVVQEICDELQKVDKIRRDYWKCLAPNSTSS